MAIPNNIILSRTDGVGDMVLMLPMAGVLKKNYPHIKIAVLGKEYTKAIVAACIYVDEFIDEDLFFTKEITICNQPAECIIHVRTNKAVAQRAKQLKIPMRIGTSSRLYHWLTCTQLVGLKRKTSTLHEAQLNIKLLKPLGITKAYTLQELQLLIGLHDIEKLEAQYATFIAPNKFNLIIHSKSQGSSREWPIKHFITLINLLPETTFNVFLSGVEKEKPFVQQIMDGINRPVINIVGKMNLEQFISFIKSCDALLANATGPVHIAAALGIHALGLYPPIKPIHPARWMPLGEKVKVFVNNKNCNNCKKNKEACACMLGIAPVEVAGYLQKINAASKINI